MLDPIAYWGILAVILVTVPALKYAGSRKIEHEYRPHQYHTCFICGDRDERVRRTLDHRYGGYYYFHYHIGCVVDVVCCPQRYQSVTVDQALSIIKLTELERQEEKEREIRKIQRTLQQKSECKKACAKINEGLLSS